MTIRAELTERFLRYVAIESQSDARATALPSTPGQQSLADLLARELRALGLSDVVVDDHATVTAVKRGNRPARHGSASSLISTRSILASRPSSARRSCASRARISA